MGFIISSALVFLCATLLLKEAVSQCPHSKEPVKTLGTKCYEFVIHRRLTRHAAKTYCTNKHGHLVTIDSKSVQDFVYQTLVSLGYGGEGVWIGLTDEGHENRYTWDSGSTTTYTHWAPGQPGILHSFEDCVLLHMQEHGQWHDYRCSDLLFITEHDAFVCEYDRGPVTTGFPTTFVPTTHRQTTIPPTTEAPATMLPTQAPTTTSPTQAPTTALPTQAPSTLILTDAVVATDTLAPTTTEPDVLIGKK